MISTSLTKAIAIALYAITREENTASFALHHIMETQTIHIMFCHAFYCITYKLQWKPSFLQNDTELLSDLLKSQIQTNIYSVIIFPESQSNVSLRHNCRCSRCSQSEVHQEHDCYSNQSKENRFFSVGSHIIPPLYTL